MSKKEEEPSDCVLCDGDDVDCPVCENGKIPIAGEYPNNEHCITSILRLYKWNMRLKLVDDMGK